MQRTKPANPASMITMDDIKGWYLDNPLPVSKAQASFPMQQNTKGKSWRTISNAQYINNEAADPISLNSTVPVVGRDGYNDVSGDMVSFGKAREMTADDIEQFEELKIKFAELPNAATARQLVNYYGNDLNFVRNAMMTEMAYLDWALISNACDIGYLTTNSPYMQGLATMSYGVSAWQKDAVTTAWANAAALILDDIQSALTLAQTQNKVFTTIFINKTWWTHVKNNTQIQKYTSSLAANLLSTQSAPTLEEVNTMLVRYFDESVSFVIVDESVTRNPASGTKTTANPFANGVAVFAQSPVLGHFEWNGVPIIDASIETYESFFLVGNKLKTDPSHSKIYAKGRGFPVIDTYADNFYLKVDAVAW